MPASLNPKTVMTQLERWAAYDAQIAPDHFKCPYFEKCNASVNGELRGGEGCCMSYVGHRYGRDFRLAVVGMDHGEFDSSTHRQRQEGIQNVYVRDGNEFNQHYAGVVKTAAVILGKSAVHCRLNCTASCHRTPDARCVINRIAQPNLVRCVPHTQDDRMSRASRVMKRNCARHLVAELRIIRPNLVVFLGVQSRGWIRRAELELSSFDLMSIKECSDKYGPVLYRSAGLAAYFLFLYHPSRGWLDRQWSQVDEWIKYLRNRQLIPD